MQNCYHDIINAALQAYRRIINSRSLQKPAEKDIAAMQDNREKIVAWILAEDYGVKVARQNNIPWRSWRHMDFRLMHILILLTAIQTILGPCSARAHKEKRTLGYAHTGNPWEPAG